jgi:hypothetical protein
VVFGHGGDAVRAAFPDAGIEWALQAEQLGTGHAVMQALPALSRDEPVHGPLRRRAAAARRHAGASWPTRPAKTGWAS